MKKLIIWSIETETHMAFMLAYIEKNQLLWLYETNKKILLLYMNIERDLVYNISFYIGLCYYGSIGIGYAA